MPDIITQDALFFFDGQPVELGLYEQLAAALLSRYPDAEIRVKKTQIGFYCPGLFCCVSLTPVRRKAERPERFITVTFGLDHPLDDPPGARRARSAEPLHPPRPSRQRRGDR